MSGQGQGLTPDELEDLEWEAENLVPLEDDWKEDEDP